MKISEMNELSLEEKLVLQQALLSFVTARKATLRNIKSFQNTLNHDIQIAEKLQRIFNPFED
jgi:predicted trehalose synthase